MKYELWHARDGETAVYTLLPAGAVHEPPLLEKDARVIWSIEAESWEDARRGQHEFLGWEAYEPLESR